MLILYFENFNNSCSFCPSCSNESNQSYTYFLYGTITELYLVCHMEVQLLKQSPKLKVFAIKGNGSQSLVIISSQAFQSNVCSPTGYEGIISHPLHHSSD